ncbi:MAG: trypsin-like peptidase domain-containing protein [Clostridia bacterium]|nr:trypsin-like peptidase domain-containing protein [Clostridia bacterium]
MNENERTPDGLPAEEQSASPEEQSASPEEQSTSPEEQSISPEEPTVAPDPEPVTPIEADNPAVTAAAEQPIAEPAAQPATDGSYHLSGDQIPKADGYMPPNPYQNGNPYANPYQSGNPMPSRNEYEVSYDSASGRYTYTYSENKAQPPQKKKKGGKIALIIGGAVLLLILCMLLGLMGGAIGSAIENDIQAQKDMTASVVTQTVVSVNTADVTETLVMQAAAKAVNSVVVIDTYTSQMAANAGEQSGAGSGVIWTADGYIVTCNHVVDGYPVIRVTLADGSTYYADVVGSDSRTDLAVLKIGATGLSAVTVRGTDLVLAETVIAIGNPLGMLSNTVSTGILSCLAREITVEGQPMSLLQTDAAVNHGNSGGGLFDANGSLIGIVNAKSTGDSVEGLGFAIPINTVMDISGQIIESGYVTGRPRLGITVVTVTNSNSSYVFDEEYYPKLKEYATTTRRDIWGREHTQVVPGVYIYDITLVAGYAEGSEELQFGDRILYVGNTEISGNSDVLAALNNSSAGDTIQITVQRNHETTIVVNVILGQQGS